MSSYKYAKLPSSPCQWGWNSGTSRIYQALGIEGKKIPKSMHGEYKVDGWSVVIKRGKTGARVGTPRVFVRSGGELIPAGRVYQALCGRAVFKARKKAAAQRGTGGRFKYRPRPRAW